LPVRTTFDLTNPEFRRQLLTLKASDYALWQQVGRCFSDATGQPWGDFVAQYRWTYQQRHFSEMRVWGTFWPVADKVEIYAAVEAPPGAVDEEIQPLLFYSPKGLNEE
jgi:hypothetical protein